MFLLPHIDFLGYYLCNLQHYAKYQINRSHTKYLTLKRSSHLTMHMPSQCNFPWKYFPAHTHHLSFCPAARQHIPGIACSREVPLPAIMQSNIFFFIDSTSFLSLSIQRLFSSFCDSFFHFFLFAEKKRDILCKTAKYPSYFMQYFPPHAAILPVLYFLSLYMPYRFLPRTGNNFLFHQNYGLFPM